MTSHQKVKFSCFTLEGVNSFAMVLYFNYLYFLMQSRFGFGDKSNLAVAACLGFIYVFAAWQAGKFAQRRGYFTALKIGFSIMAVSLAAGLFLEFRSPAKFSPRRASPSECASSGRRSKRC